LPRAGPIPQVLLAEAWLRLEEIPLLAVLVLEFMPLEETPRPVGREALVFMEGADLDRSPGPQGTGLRDLEVPIQLEDQILLDMALWAWEEKVLKRRSKMY
jgi:hypothetical protein